VGRRDDKRAWAAYAAVAAAVAVEWGGEACGEAAVWWTAVAVEWGGEAV
jgi:hypothetical protein